MDKTKLAEPTTQTTKSLAKQVAEINDLVLLIMTLYFSEHEIEKPAYARTFKDELLAILRITRISKEQFKDIETMMLKVCEMAEG